MAEVEEWIFAEDREIVGVVVCTRKVVKIKELLPFCGELSTLYIKD